MNGQRDRVAWGGLAIVGITAIVWSFTALSDLARRVGVTATIPIPWTDQLVHVAWGLPITVDVLALVATRVWLRGVAPEEAVTYARRAAWGAIVATILGNAYHGALVGAWRVDSLIVSAAPAVVIGVIVHLAVLAGRPQTEPTQDTEEEDKPEAVGDDVPFEPTAADRDKIRPIALPALDEALIADVRKWAVARAAVGADRPSRDDLIDAYSIGAGRARKIRRVLGWADEPEAVDVEPTGADR